MVPRTYHKVKVNLQKHSYNAELIYPAEYLEIQPTQGEDRINLFLHGYAENAEIFYKRISNVFELEHRSLFLNGSFPIPKIRGDIVLYQYAWYFYNSVENNYYIDFKTPIESIKKLLLSLNLSSNVKITIIGYSQGGYLAPFLAANLPAADRVIAINASIREDKLEGELNFQLDQIHATKDEKVDYTPVSVDTVPYHRSARPDPSARQSRRLTQYPSLTSDQLVTN